MFTSCRLYNTSSFLVFPIIHRNFLISTIHTINFVLVFLSDRATVCSICNCCCPDHCFIHLIFQLAGYPFFGQHTCLLFAFHPSYIVTFGCWCHSLILQQSRRWIQNTWMLFFHRFSADAGHGTLNETVLILMELCRFLCRLSVWCYSAREPFKPSTQEVISNQSWAICMADAKAVGSALSKQLLGVG